MWGDTDLRPARPADSSGATRTRPTTTTIIWGDSMTTTPDPAVSTVIGRAVGTTRIARAWTIAPVRSPVVVVGGRRAASSTRWSALRTTPHPFEWLLFAALALLTGSFTHEDRVGRRPASRSPTRSSSPRRCCSVRRRRRSRSRRHAIVLAAAAHSLARDRLQHGALRAVDVGRRRTRSSALAGVAPLAQRARADARR